MYWAKSVPTSFVSDSGDSGFQSSDKRGLTVFYFSKRLYIYQWISFSRIIIFIVL